MALINAEARHLQADDTVAVDPNGLDAPGQHTSAYDLALFARQALTHAGVPEVRPDHQRAVRVSPAQGGQPCSTRTRCSTNYPGAVGGKIGWTSAAGATYVGMATGTASR